MTKKNELKLPVLLDDKNAGNATNTGSKNTRFI